MKDYTMIRTLSGIYSVFGWVVIVAAMFAFFFVAVAAPDPFKPLSIAIGIGGIVLGATFVGTAELLNAVIDTAQSASASAETLDELAEKLDQLIAIQARASGDLDTLAGTVRKRDQA